MFSINCSFKYNPGHFSHLIASYKIFESIGEDTCLFINKKFYKMDPENNFIKYSKFSDFKTKNINKAVIWFPSLKNIILIFYLFIFHKSKIYYVFHEPFDSFKNYRHGGFSYYRILKLYLIDFVNIITLKFSSVILLPSKKSFQIYEERYKFFNSNFHLVPLLFDDEANIDDLKLVNKKYISYIGTIAEDHAFNKYIDFLVSSIDDVEFKNYDFLIATKSNICEKIYSKIKEYVEIGRVRIIQGRPMGNSEINDCYLRSLVVWNAYDRSNQSGVLPKAFMFGTPVIVTTNNLSEFLDNYKNGIIISDNTNYNEIKNAIVFITQNQKKIQDNCRDSFLKTFYFNNHLEIFK